MQTTTAPTEKNPHSWLELAQNAHQKIKDADPKTEEGRQEMFVGLAVMQTVEEITRPDFGGNIS